MLGLVLFTQPISNALAGQCGDDIRRIDEALKNQYGGSGAWWEWFAYPVCLGID